MDIAVPDTFVASAVVYHLSLFASASALSSALASGGVSGPLVASITMPEAQLVTGNVVSNLDITSYRAKASFVAGGVAHDYDESTTVAISNMFADEADVIASNVVVVVEDMAFGSGRRLQSSPDWSVVASDFSDTMTLTAMVTVDGVDKSSGTLGAFVGSQARGVQSSPSLAPFGAYAGKSVFQVTAYANAGGEALEFKFHDGASTADMA